MVINDKISNLVNMVEFDDFGPEMILEFYHPRLNFHAVTVIDNTALGPAKGGIRMTPTVNVNEVFKLARAMTWKCALAGLPFGGGKSGIAVDSKKISLKKKKAIIEAFAEYLKRVAPKYYVAAPDMYMAEQEMAWISKKAKSRNIVTGKPKKMGGIPHELGSTGFGVYHAALVALKHMKKDPKDVTFAVEGFGNVGWFVAKFLCKKGAKMVAASDSKGVICDYNGIDFKELARIKKKTGTVINYKNKKTTKCSKILSIKADVLITAAIPDLIKSKDVKSLKFKLIVEGSNIPMSRSVEYLLHQKKIVVIPDFVANAGGVISSYVEYKGGTPRQMFRLIEKKIKKNTTLVLDLAKRKNLAPRQAGLEIAKRRVLKKCKRCKV